MQHIDANTVGIVRSRGVCQKRTGATREIRFTEQLRPLVGTRDIVSAMNAFSNLCDFLRKNHAAGR